jgi:serine/threonine protein kinase
MADKKAKRKKEKVPYLPSGKPIGEATSKETAKPTADDLEKADHVKRSLEKIVGGRLKATRERKKRVMLIEASAAETDMSDSDKHEALILAYIEESASLRAHRATRAKIKASDFKIIKVIGKGAFGEVRIVRDKDGKVYAMKTMVKKMMVSKNQMGHVVAERDLMAAADNPWLVKLDFAFQDSTFLYLVMEFCGGGDLMGLLIKKDILTERDARFYMSELACAINYVHEMGFVHRDLKPDNVLISNDGHIRLSDFGLAKSFESANDLQLGSWQKYVATLRAEEIEAGLAAGDDEKDDSAEAAAAAHRDRKMLMSTVGTPDYIALEVLYQKGYDKSVDWWSLGVIMFECLIGYAPFHAKDPLSTCRKIVRYEKYFKVPADVKLSRFSFDLLKRLVCPVHRRIGWLGIKKHAWFKKIPWDDLMSQKPPFQPKLSSDIDASYFDAMDGEHTVEAEVAAADDDDDGSFFADKVMGYTFKRGEVEAMKKLGVSS